jgi:stearoyl-CoA desaturase (delta-9 desaturase)
MLDERCDPVSGSVHWDPARSLWNGGMLVGSVVLGPLFLTPGAIGVFLALLALTMCAVTGVTVTLRYRLTTPFNWYVKPFAEWLLGDLLESNLGFYRRRAERASASLDR